MVGEPFGLQPYAVAIQQGSQLSKEISDVILDLQKEKYFEILQAKYWNSTQRTLCPILDDSAGMYLDFVFIQSFILVCYSVQESLRLKTQKLVVQIIFCFYCLLILR